MAKLEHISTSAKRRFVLPGRPHDIRQIYGGLAGLLLLILFNILFTARFLTLQTLDINLTQVAPTAIVATGMTLVIATGGIDLSVGSLMAIAGALAPIIFLSNFPVFQNQVSGNIAAIILPLVVVGVLGLFNGILVTRFRIQPIIATLILFVAGRGIAQVLTNGNLQVFQNPGFQFIGQGRIVGIPFQAILMIIIVLTVAVIMRISTFGRYILAAGGNEKAARLSGVPVNRVKLAVYTISALLAGLAGFIIISINSSADANQVGLNMELDAIAAAAVGGTPLLGGQANVVGTLIGALIIQLIRSTLLSHNIPFAVAQVIDAAIILLAVYAQRQRKS